MAQLIKPFNAQEHDPATGIPSLPIGKHPVVITGSEVKATQANDGGYLQLDLKIIDGPQTGTTGAYRLNLYNASEKAAEIAHKQMSAICHVTGLGSTIVTDSAMLHNLPFVIEVAFQKGHAPGTSADAKGYTEVVRVLDMQGNEAGKQAQGQAQAGNQGQSQAQAQNQAQNGGGWGQGQAQGQQQTQEQPQPQQQNQAQGQGQTTWGQGQEQAQPQQQAQNAGWNQNANTGTVKAPWNA